MPEVRPALLRSDFTNIAAAFRDAMKSQTQEEERAEVLRPPAEDTSIYGG